MQHDLPTGKATVALEFDVVAELAALVVEVALQSEAATGFEAIAVPAVEVKF